MKCCRQCSKAIKEKNDHGWQVISIFRIFFIFARVVANKHYHRCRNLKSIDAKIIDRGLKPYHEVSKVIVAKLGCHVDQNKFDYYMFMIIHGWSFASTMASICLKNFGHIMLSNLFFILSVPVYLVFIFFAHFYELNTIV